MFDRFLVPLDGSALAERAIPYAVALARATRGGITLLHVTQDVTSSVQRDRIGDGCAPGQADQLALGGVATATLHRTHVPLLIVRPAGLRGQSGEGAAPE